MNPTLIKIIGPILGFLVGVLYDYYMWQSNEQNRLKPYDWKIAVTRYLIFLLIGLGAAFGIAVQSPTPMAAEASSTPIALLGLSLMVVQRKPRAFDYCGDPVYGYLPIPFYEGFRDASRCPHEPCLYRFTHWNRFWWHVGRKVGAIKL